MIMLYLAGLAVLTVFCLKLADWFRAWRFNCKQAKQAHRDAVYAAYLRGFQEAVGACGRIDTYRAKLVTPDRPKDVYLERAWKEIEKMTGGAV